MKQWHLFAVLFSLACAMAFGAIGVESPSTPAPLPSYLTIKQTGQASIATITQIITGTADPQNILLHNESGDMLRIGTTTAALSTGFGLPAGGVLYLNLSPRVNLYLDSSGTAVISYIKGE
jgi:hypothetical protein